MKSVATHGDALLQRYEENPSNMKYSSRPQQLPCSQ